MREQAAVCRDHSPHHIGFYNRLSATTCARLTELTGVAATDRYQPGIVA